MIINQRTYTIPTGLLRDFLSLYATEGRAVQIEHLGACHGYYTTEVGELNQVVHLQTQRKLTFLLQQVLGERFLTLESLTAQERLSCIGMHHYRLR